jgi:hypothetical protein
MRLRRDRPYLTAPAPVDAGARLAVRRRSLSPTPSDGGVRLSGVVTDTLLFGDDREVAGRGSGTRPGDRAFSTSADVPAWSPARSHASRARVRDALVPAL